MIEGKSSTTILFWTSVFLLAFSLVLLLGDKRETSYFEINIVRFKLNTSHGNIKEIEVSDSSIFNRTLEVEHLSRLLLEETKKLETNLLQNTGPIIVGGVGDSGTRAVWSLLQKLGVKMGKVHQKQVKSDSKDSKIFMKTYQLTWSNGTEYNISAPQFYNRGLKSRTFHPNDFSSNALYSKNSMNNAILWKQGLFFTSRVINEVYEKHYTMRQRSHDKAPFGFKHPRTILMLPFFRETLGNRFKFVHVIRDGREVSLATNRNMYASVCSKYYGKRLNASFCDNTKSSRLKFWSHLNLEATHYAEMNIKNQYKIFRIEDLVVGNTQCLHNVLEFLQIQTVEEEFEVLLNSFKMHNTSYLGHKFNEKTKGFLTKKANNIEVTRDAFDRYGYMLQNQFGIKGCPSS